jgi:hypothetical protein
LYSFFRFNLLKLLIPTLFFLFFLSHTHATHLMGGDLSYECLGGNQYKITLKVYRDCNGINAGSYEVIYITANCGTGYQTMSKTSITEITPTCPGFTGSSCNGGSGTYGVEEHIYQTTVTIPSSCVNIDFYWRRCCRNGAINTFPLHSQNVCISKR